MNWVNLSAEQKTAFKNHCDDKYGKTFMFCQHAKNGSIEHSDPLFKEPIYMNNEGKIIDTQIEIDLLFPTNLN